MRDWNSEARRNHDVLVRIVAMLVALADLADLASSLSAPRRWRLLEILLYGEAEAFAFVTGMATDAVPLGIPALANSFGAPAFADELEPAFAGELEQACDPARLAASLRALALALWSILAVAPRLALPGAAGQRAGQHKPTGPAGLLRLAALPAPDTS